MGSERSCTRPFPLMGQMVYRCRANMAHTRMSRPVYGLGFQVNISFSLPGINLCGSKRRGFREEVHQRVRELPREVDVRLSGKGVQSPMAQGRSTIIIAMIKWIRTTKIISNIKWIRTSRLSIRNLSLCRGKRGVDQMAKTRGWSAKPGHCISGHLRCDKWIALGGLLFDTTNTELEDGVRRNLQSSTPRTQESHVSVSSI